MIWAYQRSFLWYTAVIVPCVVLLSGIITLFCYATKDKDNRGLMERFSDLEN
jgi:hypothetical protein